jgi:hypothetical protein
MIFFATITDNFEEEEEEGEATVDDALLAELDDEDIDDTLLDEVIPSVVPAPDLLEEEEELPAVDPLFGEEEDEEDMDYDSFDDKDEL